ncbi:MAG: type II/IV secretion system protein, partial [Gemmatimonadales bacterium]
MALLRKKRQRLGEILLERGVLTATGLRDTMAHAEKNRLRLGEAAIALHLADEEEVTRALADQFDIPYLELTNDTPVTESNLLPEDIIRSRWVMPLTRDNGKLQVAITDPQDIETMDMLRFRLNAEITPVLVSKGGLKRYLDKGAGDTNLSIDAAVDELRRTSMDLAPDEASGLDLLGDDSSAPIVKLVTMLITQAVEMRCSDIHIEPMTDRVRVRYRVDGVCLDRPKIPKRMQGPVINRLKIMAGIDLAEKRLPTDGRIKMLIGGSQIDFRVSCLPGYHGESVVLRILRPESVRLGIPALGFDQSDYERFIKTIRRPNGIFLVTGPTGSGKTTTLYAAVNELN